MELTTRIIAHPDRHPAIDRALTMPVNSAMVVFSDDTSHGGVEDVLLRTGQGGWRTARQMDDRYMNEVDVERFVRRHVARGFQFALTEGEDA